MYRIHVRSPRASYKKLCCSPRSPLPLLPGRVMRLLIFCPGPVWFISSWTQRPYFIQGICNAFVLWWLTCLRSAVWTLCEIHISLDLLNESSLEPPPKPPPPLWWRCGLFEMLVCSSTCWASAVQHHLRQQALVQLYSCQVQGRKTQKYTCSSQLLFNMTDF